MRTLLRVMACAALLLSAVAADGLPAQQATGTVTGTVRDRQTGQPVTGVQVFILGTRMGQLTNESGRYLILRVPAGQHQVTSQMIGYAETKHPVTVVAGQTATVDFAIEQTVLTLDEIVVSGVSDPTAGVKVPFTVSKVQTEQLQVPTVNSALASIQGKVAGVNIVRASGRPGAGVNIVLRSATSFEGSNSPLIVVDGVVIARELNNTTSDIESLDIESIEIIKGAAAASLYGSRAAAGVVSITTNRGRTLLRNATRITSRTEFGGDYLAGEIPITTAHPYMMNAAGTGLINAEGRDTTWAGRTTRTVALSGGNARMMDQPYPGRTYDNLHALYRPGRYLSQNFAVSHNAENTTFLAGLSTYDQAGALANNDGFQRNTGRFSLDHRIGQLASFSFTGNHTRTWTDGVSGNPYTAILTYPTYVDLTRKDEQGNYLMFPDSSVEVENPLWRQASRDNFTKRARTQGSLSARVTPLPWVVFDLQLSYDKADTKEQQYVPKGTPVSADSVSTGLLYLEHAENDAFNGAIGATLSRQLGNLNARLALRGTVEREKYEYFYAQGIDMIAQDVRTLAAAATLDDMYSYGTDIRANGMYADLALDFKDRYIGSFLIRRDGSSLFGPLQRWHTYKRASAAYVISREPWFNVPFINEMKLRYAMGEAGGRPGFSQQYETWDLSRTSGATRGNAGNPTLKPQFTREQDMGVQVTGLGNRVQLELVYARQYSRDQIILVPATVITGYSSLYANAAVQKGRTYEATITAYPLRTQNTTWSININADNSRTKLVEWNRSCFFGTNATAGREHEYTCAGEAAGDFWMQQTARSATDLPSWLQSRADEFDVNDDGYLVWVGKKADGTPNTWKDGIAYANQADKCQGSGSAVTGGCGWGSYITAGGNTYRWGEPFRVWDEDLNAVKRVNLGTSLPDVSFGFGTSLRYKGFSSYLGFRGQLGGKVYNEQKMWFYSQLRHGDLDQRGKPDEEKKPLDYYQRALAQNDAGYVDVFLEDGTFLKLGEARVSYRLRRDQISKLFGRLAPAELTLGLNGRNLLTLTGYSGMDPEAGIPLSRVEGIGYPFTRTLTATVDITF